LIAGLVAVTACGQAPPPAHTEAGAPLSRSSQERVLSADDLSQRTIERRAIEAAIWGIPIVNTDMMFRAFARDGKGAVNQIAYFSRLPDWKNQTLTPNPDAMYFMPFFSTKDVGPIVIEIPPAESGSITGSLMDAWQVALEDVGPAGVDKGKGGKYLILPPGYKEKPPAGFVVLPSHVYQGYGLLRSILKSRSEADVAAAVAYGKRIKLYPLSAAANPPAMMFVDMVDVVFDATIPYDVRFFESLDRMVQSEPWIERDRVMVNALQSLGIQKGQPFAPDAKTKDALTTGVREARAWFDQYYETHFEPFNAGTRWILPADKTILEAEANGFSDTNTYPIDGRGLAYYFAFSAVKHMGEGQFYLFATRDKDGQILDGAMSYRLHVPPRPPVRQYWSVVLYDFGTHALIRDMKWSSRSSLEPDIEKNADGSVDVYFGPQAPAGKEKNWVPTKPGGRFEALFRLYGPEQALFAKTWVLPDIERMK
jgi:hypothetical protein